MHDYVSKPLCITSQVCSQLKHIMDESSSVRMCNEDKYHNWVQYMYVSRPECFYIYIYIYIYIYLESFTHFTGPNVEI